MHSSVDLAPSPAVVKPVGQSRQDGPELNWPWGQVVVTWHSAALEPGAQTVEGGRLNGVGGVRHSAA